TSGTLTLQAQDGYSLELLPSDAAWLPASDGDVTLSTQGKAQAFIARVQYELPVVAGACCVRVAVGDWLTVVCGLRDSVGAAGFTGLPGWVGFDVSTGSEGSAGCVDSFGSVGSSLGPDGRVVTLSSPS